ncbi:uncharacterized protein LOC122250136 [Penaeus japonicus]|uniref:uncharacterized protein LOC122250136 n=1 Tax=Penaeus japonicus TaxID=27405 RepID=UPI001C710D9D|nr:uncharacterized protein LOC122250136 [Penaeus japonicus]
MATETEMSVDSLDTSLVDLTIGEATMERLTNSIMKSADRKSPIRPDAPGLPEDETSADGGRDDDLGVGVGGIPLDLSMKVSTSAGSSFSPPTSHAKNLTAQDVSDRDKLWAGSMRDLSHTVDKILSSGGGLSKDRRPSDLSYMGVSPALGEMLLQHGEFPATPLFTPTPRYRSTPLDVGVPPFRVADTTRGHNVAFAASIASSLGQSKHNMADLTYGMRNPLDQRSAHLVRSFMMATPENLVPETTPKFTLTGLQQSTLTSLPSVVSWRAGEGEGRWSSFSPAASWSHGSASVSASASSSAHFYSPLNSDESYPRPQHDEPPFKARRSDSRPNPYHDSRPPIPAAHTSHSNVHAAQLSAAHFSPPAHPNAHAAHQMPYAPKTQEGVGVGGLSPRKALIQDVVLKESTRAFRSHPLFPLLKDLSVADYYFDKAAFNIGPLLSYLPTSTEDLVSLYLRRNPEVAQSYRCHQTSSHSPAVDAVLLDAIAYAHSCLLEKVSTQAAQLAATVEAEAADTEAAVEEMCQRYMEVIRSSTPLHIFQPVADEPPATTGGETNADPPGLENDHLSDPIQQLEQLLAPFSPIPPTFFSAHDTSGNSLMNASLNGSDSRRRTHQHPREAIEVLTAWLSEHRDHPYPDDEQKASLVRRTGLSTQQVAHWFTNARRRLLPKLRADLTKE